MESRCRSDAGDVDVVDVVEAIGGKTMTASSPASCWSSTPPARRSAFVLITCCETRRQRSDPLSLIALTTSTITKVDERNVYGRASLYCNHRSVLQGVLSSSIYSPDLDPSAWGLSFGKRLPV